GNPGTTRGAQRLYVFRKAAETWGRYLNSTVPIRIQASMASQTCDASANLARGTVAPRRLNANFAGAARPATWYASALANAMAGQDLEPGEDDIEAQFNADIDAGCYPGIAGWWYGVDPAVPVPADRISLLSAIVAELGHGIGFQAEIDPYNGQLCCSIGDSNVPVWAYYLYDLDQEFEWLYAGNAERAASATNEPYLVWAGPRANQAAKAYVKERAPLIVVDAPAAVAGLRAEPQRALFGPTVPANGITAGAVWVQGAEGQTDACDTLANAAALAGKIALVDRGNCRFADKTLRAQAAGAVATIIVNNTAGALYMAGIGNTLAIPTVGVAQSFGNALRNESGIALTLGRGTGRAGTTEGCLRMLAPATATPDSISHFSAQLPADVAMTVANYQPPQPMKLELAVALLADIGWSTNEDLIFYGDFEPPCRATVAE
ncbi:MAG TPA: PA domain-containing protein, partial [Tahibacter sp.]|nr:PA domain-containing protein [Tahibacter sp.]